jgi:hypothetical protein
MRDRLFTLRGRFFGEVTPEPRETLRPSCSSTTARFVAPGISGIGVLTQRGFVLSQPLRPVPTPPQGRPPPSGRRPLAGLAAPAPSCRRSASPSLASRCFLSPRFRTFGMGRRGLEPLTPCASCRQGVLAVRRRSNWCIEQALSIRPLLLTGADEALTVDPDEACAPEDRDTECMVTKVLHRCALNVLGAFGRWH